jgi:hypothetical protein
MAASLRCCTTLNFFSFMAAALVVLYASRNLGLSAGAIGLAFGVGAVGGLVGSVLAGRIARCIGTGYTIALGGLIYYKLGAEKLKEYLGQGSMKWQEFGHTRPILRKLMIFAAVIISMFMILGSLGPRYAPDSAAKAYTGIGKLMGEKNV